MTPKPNPTRTAAWRVRSAWWVAITVLIALAACSGDPEPAPQVSFPATPTGTAIASVVDVPLGDVHIRPFLGGVAMDDVTGALFWVGRETVSSDQQAHTVNAVDRTTGASTVLATVTAPSAFFIEHLVATNGWVFWVEVDYSSREASGQQSLVYMAIKADGTQRTTLARYQASAESELGEPSANSGIQAGGGTAMWLEITKKARTVHLFDTRTATQLLVQNQPAIRDIGAVHGDRVALWTYTGVQVYSIGSGQLTRVDSMFYGVLNAEVLAGWDPKPSRMTACFFASSGNDCIDPVAIDVPQSIWPRCILGTYVVGYSGDRYKTVELLNVASPWDRTSFPSGGLAACSGKSLISVWSVWQYGDLMGHSYIRVITVA